MATHRKVKYQIRLIAFTQNDDGTRCVYDIIETDFHYAYYFAKRYMRNTDVCSFIACQPDATVGKEWVRQS